MAKLKSVVAGTIDGSWIEGPIYWVWGLYRPHTWFRYCDRRYNTLTRRVLSRVLKPDSNAVDIGCCHGDILKTMVGLAPRGSHHAFEPAPDLAAELRRRFPTVTVHELAISDHAGSADFFHSPAAFGYSSLYKQGPPGAAVASPKLTVELKTLDAVLPIDLPIALIKIDVEGAELDVFRGAEGVLRRFRPIIVFEHAGESAAMSQQIFDLLVGEHKMSLQTLTGWLKRRPPLSRDAFLEKTRKEWMFVGSPIESNR